eukprot:15358398-Ditylum_brightwellii.AAC.1
MTKRGYKLKLHKLDNKSSRDLQQRIQAQQTKLQFTPPKMYCTNAAEKTMQTWKNHFLSGLSSLPSDFPITYWCRLVPQANLTLNIMHPCCINANISTHTAMMGCYNFKANPMAPPGTKAYIHTKTNN